MLTIANLYSLSLSVILPYNMAMLLGFKTKLKLNNQQRTQMDKHAVVARHAWNWGLSLTKQILDHNQNNPEDKIKFPSAIDREGCWGSPSIPNRGVDFCCCPFLIILK